MFSILIITCLILFNQQVFIRTAVINSNDLLNETLAEDNTVNEEATTLSAIEITTSIDSSEIDEPIDKSSIPDDVIELNIGGQKMTTLRSTLTVIPQSKLAKMFNRKNSNMNLPRDQHGAVFFDYNPMQFSYLLDQLRALKRQPKQPVYQIQFQAPYSTSQMNFTHMLVDLGLTADYFLTPTEGTHINLTVSSLAGWKECYRSTYNIPFDFSVLKKTCNASRLLVACQPVNNKKILTLAGIGQYEDVLHPCLPKQCKINEKSKKKSKKLICSSNYQCITQAKRGVGWYNANNQTWGFVRGSLSFVVNPCDASDLDSDYRLCWTSQTVTQKGAGDRCGNERNLHNSTKWERVIYKIV